MTQSSYPISMLRQHLFCPRIPYFANVRDIHPVPPTWTGQGIAWHEVQLRLAKRRNLSRFGLGDRFRLDGVNVSVQSTLLHLHGICDAVLAAEDEICPIELKKTYQSAFSQATKIQLLTYAIALQEMTGKKVRKAFILYGDRGQTLPISVTESGIRNVERICAEMRRNFESCLLPDSPASEAKCCQCEYRNFCADR